MNINCNKNKIIFSLSLSFVLWIMSGMFTIYAQDTMEVIEEKDEIEAIELKKADLIEMMDLPYYKVPKESFIGSASSIYSKELSTVIGHSLAPAMYGRLSGLSVRQATGFQDFLGVKSTTWSEVDWYGNYVIMENAYPDNSQYGLSARGMEPVVIVDGIRRDFFNLNAESIESITILKDALSTLSYGGMRSAKPVLVITTKKPVNEGFHLSFTGKYGIQQAIKKPQPLSADVYAYMLNEALINDGKKPLYTIHDFETFSNGSSPYTHPNVYWRDELLRNNSPTQSYDFSASGASKKSRFYINLGYLSEDGPFKESNDAPYRTNSNYERYQIISKINVDVTSRLHLDLSLIGRMESFRQPGAGAGSILEGLVSTPNSAYPMYNPDSTYRYGGNHSFQRNLAEMTMNSGYRTGYTRDGSGCLTLKFDMNTWVQGLSATAVLNLSNQSRWIRVRDRQSPVYEYLPPANEGGTPKYVLYGEQYSLRNYNVDIFFYQSLFTQVQIDWQRQFGKHAVSAKVFGDREQVLLNYNIPRQIIDVTARVTYDYDKKYFFEAMFSKSYFNQYHPNYRWDTYGGFGLGWNLTREDFLKNISGVDLVKIRGVYGLTGNGIDNAGYYNWMQLYHTAGILDGIAHPSLGYNRGWYGIDVATGEKDMMLINTSLRPEKAHKINAGLDLAFLKNRLLFNGDYYFHRHFDVVMERGKSIQLMGMRYGNENIGIHHRRGLEVEIKWTDKIGELMYMIGGNWSIHHSKVVFMDEQDPLAEHQRRTGKPVGAVLGLLSEGLYQSQEEIDAGPTWYEMPKPGDIKYKKITPGDMLTDADRDFIMGLKPPGLFCLDLGLSWKGFELTAMFQGEYNREIYLPSAVGGDFLFGFQTRGTQGNKFRQGYEHMIGRWTPETAATAEWPRLTTQNSVWNHSALRDYGATDFWVHSCNYFRLRSVSLSYSLPDAFCKKNFGGVKAKFFVNGQNLWTVSAINLVDPEVTSYAYGNYPAMKGMNVGVTLNF